MNVYVLLKFVHVLGAVGFFAAFASEWLGAEELRRASAAEQARHAISISNRVRWVGAPSLVLALGSGIYLASSAWSWQVGWIAISLGALLLMPILGGAVNGRKIAALEKALPASGPLDESWRARVGDPLLSLSLRVRIAIALGIVFLMTVKPVETWRALAVMAAAMIAGVAANLPRWRQSWETSRVR
jgi:hypothetical protein